MNKSELQKEIVKARAALNELEQSLLKLNTIENELDSYSSICAYLRSNKLQYIRDWETSDGVYTTPLAVSYSAKMQLVNTSIALTHLYSSESAYKWLFELHTNAQDEMKVLITRCNENYSVGAITFNCLKGAEHSLRILGEETIKTALLW